MFVHELDFSKFYLLGESNQDSLQLTRSDKINTNEDFEIIHHVFKGNIVPIKPVEIKMYKVGNKYDFHSHIEEKIISHRILNVLSDYRFSGYTTFPVIFLDKKKKSIDGYVGLSVTGKCGPLLNEKRERKTKYDSELDNIYDVYVGCYFDPDTWDGSDIFSPEESAAIIVTEKVKLALEAANITNVAFERLTEFESLWE